MGRRLDALNEIAVEQGYTGNEPTSVVGAINAIVEAMGGNGSAVGIADAITALAPYIGGGGDFTIATVTLQAGEAYTSAMSLNCSSIGSNGTIPFAYTRDMSAEFPVVLYKGLAFATCTLDVTITTTGNVSYNESEGTYAITGDCTFTFAGGK